MTKVLARSLEGKKRLSRRVNRRRTKTQLFDMSVMPGKGRVRSRSLVKGKEGGRTTFYMNDEKGERGIGQTTPKHLSSMQTKREGGGGRQRKGKKSKSLLLLGRRMANPRLFTNGKKGDKDSSISLLLIKRRGEGEGKNGFNY